MISDIVVYHDSIDSDYLYNTSWISFVLHNKLIASPTRQCTMEQSNHSYVFYVIKSHMSDSKTPACCAMEESVIRELLGKPTFIQREQVVTLIHSSVVAVKAPKVQLGPTLTLVPPTTALRPLGRAGRMSDSGRGGWGGIRQP